MTTTFFKLLLFDDDIEVMLADNANYRQKGAEGLCDSSGQSMIK